MHRSLDSLGGPPPTILAAVYTHIPVAVGIDVERADGNSSREVAAERVVAA